MTAVNIPKPASLVSQTRDSTLGCPTIYGTVKARNGALIWYKEFTDVVAGIDRRDKNDGKTGKLECIDIYEKTKSSQKPQVRVAASG